MSYSHDFSGISLKLFMLRHLVAGNKEFSKRGLNYRDDTLWGDYEERLRGIISNHLIEISTKMRVILDSIPPDVDHEYLAGLEKECLAYWRIGEIVDGNFNLSLRESYNKIIHARRFNITFDDASDSKDGQPYTYWNGFCAFEGSRGGCGWSILLDVFSWADAVDWFLDDICANVDF